MSSAQRTAAAKAVALLLLVGALTFWNGLGSPFVYDDAGSVLTNTSIRDLTDVSRVLRPPVETSVAGRPIVNLSFAANYAAGGTEPTGYRIVNLALHVLCAMVFFMLMQRASGSTALALAAALIWTVHPVNSEVVNYITQRTESMMALAMLLTLWWACARTPRTALAVAACAVGMASKETMVVAPILVVIYDRVFTFESWREAFRQRRQLYLGLASTWGLLAALVLWHGQTTGAGFGNAQTTPWGYFLNQPAMILRYLWLMAWPGPLVVYYGWPQAVTLAGVWLPLTAVAALFLASIALVVRRPQMGFLAVAAFLLLGPTSSFLPIATEVGAERRMYLPSMALIVLAVLGGRALLQHLSARLAWKPGQLVRAGVIATALIALPLAVRTVYRNAEYASILTLSRTLIDRWPTPNAHQLYGAALSANGRHDEAIKEFRIAVTGYPLARYFLGAELIDTDRPDEGIPELERFIREEPAQEATTVSHGMLAEAYAARKAFSAAIPHYQELVRLEPKNGNGWTGLAVALFSANRPQEAVMAFQQAVNADPANPQFRENLDRAIRVIRGGD